MLLEPSSEEIVFRFVVPFVLLVAFTTIKFLKYQQSSIKNDLALLIASTNAPVIAIDAKGLITVWNDCIAQILDSSEDEVMSTELALLVLEKDNVTQLVHNRTFAGQGCSSYEMTLVDIGEFITAT
jgi:transcriptional regulator of aromatic amino acid metabolism